MPELDEDAILTLFRSNLKVAKASLASLGFSCCKDPSFQGLSGWVFEQTVEHCLNKELKTLGVRAKIREQISIGGRATADLLIGKVAVEVKARGLFDGTAPRRYARYRAAAEAMGYAYLYLTLGEGYAPYRTATIKALGQSNAFFLDAPGDWARFIDRVANLLRSDGIPQAVALPNGDIASPSGVSGGDGSPL